MIEIPYFLWPSDLDRAESDELNRVCEYAELLHDLLLEANERIAELEAARVRIAELESLVLEAAILFSAIREGEYEVDSFTAQPYIHAILGTHLEDKLLGELDEIHNDPSDAHEFLR